MRPERLEFLGRFDEFYRMLIEQAKQNIVSEADFYMIIKAKIKSMERKKGYICNEKSYFVK